MSRESFRRALFNTVEYITEQTLRNSSKVLLLSHFNSIAGETSKEKALRTVMHYTGERFRNIGENPDRQLKNLLYRLMLEAEAWDQGESD